MSVYRSKRRRTIWKKQFVIFVVKNFYLLFYFCFFILHSFIFYFLFFSTFLSLGWRRAKRLTFTSILAYVITIESRSSFPLTLSNMYHLVDLDSNFHILNQTVTTIEPKQKFRFNKIVKIS